MSDVFHSLCGNAIFQLFVLSFFCFCLLRCFFQPLLRDKDSAVDYYVAILSRKHSGVDSERETERETQ